MGPGPSHPFSSIRTMDQDRPNRLPLIAKLFYGVGGIAVTVTMIIFGLFILFFYNSVMGLGATWVGIASAIGLVWDALVDPYIGYRSDMCRSRMGRRHPFMLAGSVTMGISLWLLLSPPPIRDGTGDGTR